MSWTTANMELDDNQTQIKSIDMNELPVRRGNFSYKSTKQTTSTILIATIFFLYFFDPFFIEGLLHYIAPFGPS